MMELITRGGPVMWLLLACSLVSLTVTLERLLHVLRRSRAGRTSPAEAVIHAARRGAFEQARSLAEDSRDPCARMLAAGLAHREHGLTESMQLEAARQLRTLKRGLGVLDTIITLAPLLGILGTVLGIIQSFDLLGNAGLQQPRAVVGGIAQALITTAAGLVVAVLSLIPYNVFVSRVQQDAGDLEAAATRLEVAVRHGEADDAH